MTEVLTELTIAELGLKLARREVSPVELAEAYLSRIGAVDDRLHAFDLVTAERARAGAVGSDTGGAIRGSDNVDISLTMLRRVV